MKLKFVLNDKQIERDDIPDDMLLIDFLHEEEGLTGTKFGCGAGECNACIVAVRDAPDLPYSTLNSCLEVVLTVNGKIVKTVEGLARDGELHPLQKAFIEHNAFQCGYSAAGFLIKGLVLTDSATLMKIEKNAVDDFVREGIKGHLCRCSGYEGYYNALKSVILSQMES